MLEVHESKPTKAKKRAAKSKWSYSSPSLHAREFAPLTRHSSSNNAIHCKSSSRSSNAISISCTMPRRTGGGSLAQPASSHVNGDAPPSTLAAKIVDSRSNVRVRQQDEGKELFSKLLHEYLSDPHLEEENLETNAKLVLVVIEAGLDLGNWSDPFSQIGHLERARDSIAVVKLTVERVPSVLFYAEGAQYAVASYPVFLVLLSKIVCCFGRPHLEEITNDALALLSTCLTAASKSDFTWLGEASLYEVLLMIIEGM